MSYADIEMKIVQWAEARKIIPNSTPDTQLLKAMSELGELADATIKKDRAGIVDGKDKSLLLNTSVLPVLGTGNAKLFHTVDNASQFQNGDLQRIAGFNLFESPTLSTPTYNAIGASAVVSASQDVASLLTASWTPTWSLAVTGGTANAVIKAGTKIKFTNGSTDVRWIVPDVNADAGFAATFTTVADVTLSGAGAGTLVLSEPFVAGGDFQNVSANLVARL